MCFDLSQRSSSKILGGISVETGETREFFLIQRLSIAIQQGDAAAILDSLSCVFTTLPTAFHKINISTLSRD